MSFNGNLTRFCFQLPSCSCDQDKKSRSKCILGIITTPDIWNISFLADSWIWPPWLPYLLWISHVRAYISPVWWCEFKWKTSNRTTREYSLTDVFSFNRWNAVNVHELMALCECVCVSCGEPQRCDLRPVMIPNNQNSHANWLIEVTLSKRNQGLFCSGSGWEVVICN